MTKIKLVIIFLIYSSATLWAIPNRVVSLSPVVTEILYAIQADDRIIQVTSACTYPPQATQKPQLDAMNPNLETLIAAEPDLVLGIGNTQFPDHKLRKIGISTHIFKSPQSISEIWTLIDAIGKLVGSEAKSDQLIKNLQTDLKTFQKNRLHSKSRPKALVLIWHPPFISVGPNTFISDMIEEAGGLNIVQTQFPHFPQLEAEFILSKNPDVIIIGHPDFSESVRSHPAIQATKAFQNGQIFDDLDTDLFSRAGPRFIHGLNAFYDRFKHVP